MHKSRQARFGLLIEAYAADLYRYAAWLCSDRAMAEDLVQETFMRAWHSLDSSKHKGAAKFWLFRMLQREHARQSNRSQAQRAEMGEGVLADVGRYDGNAEAVDLRRALAALPPEHREPLVLQVIGGFSCEEIAGILDTASSDVISHLFRARKQLREAVSNERLDRANNKVMA